MNWYKLTKIASIKISSVTFYVGDSHKISQPKGLLDLCHDFTNFVYYKTDLTGKDFSPTMQDVAPDTSSSDFDGFTGTINFYSRPRELSANEIAENSTESMAKAISLWIKDKEQEGYKFENGGNIETSQMFGYPVQRVNVIINPSSEYSQIPEVNMANDNAISMLRLLGIEVDYSGGINALDLKQRIEKVSKEQMGEETMPSGYISELPDEPRESWQGEIETYDSPPNDNGVKMYQGGRDIGYIDTRLQDLYELADFAISNGFEEIVWG